MSLAAGAGQDLVLLHGWGMSHKVWEPLLPLLESHFTVHLLDLPGHGENQFLPDGARLSDWSDSIVERIPDRALCIAWSLGALLALDLAARRPEKILNLVVVGGTPKFVCDDDWPCAMDKSVFDQFAVSLEREVDGTMQRFLALVAAGSEDVRATLKQLKNIYQEVSPIPRALNVGLELLRFSDLRSSLDEIACRVLFLNASRDRLIPATMLDNLQQGRSVIQSVLIEGCGHALFLNKPELFVRTVIDFFCGELYR